MKTASEILGNLFLDDAQKVLLVSADRVEEHFADCGTAEKDDLDLLVRVGVLTKTKSRKTPYEFTQAGCILVSLYRTILRAQRALSHAPARAESAKP